VTIVCVVVALLCRRRVVLHNSTIIKTKPQPSYVEGYFSDYCVERVGGKTTLRDITAARLARN